MMRHDLPAAARSAWATVARDFPQFGFFAPGDPSFVCIPDDCGAACCRSLAVPLSERDVARLAAFSALPAMAFLESEGGEPRRAPFEQPYTLARASGGCLFLTEARRCAHYDARPLACTTYPYQVLLLSPEDGRALSPSTGVREAARLVLEGAAPIRCLPVLVKHLDCPGFSGQPLSRRAWHELLWETLRFQYPL